MSGEHDQADRGADQDLPEDVAQEMAQRGLAEGIQIPIGLIILYFGVILLLIGIFSAPQAAGTNEINMDLWWGLLMIVFGTAFAGYGWMKSRRASRNP